RVLVELQRADSGRIALAEIVPRPSGAERLVVECIIVADDPALDSAQPARLQLLGPFVEDVWAVAHADAWIAGTDGDDVTVQNPRFNRGRRLQARLVRVVLAEPIGGRG